jgi:poly-gamma-glutamate synthesis protein (capsule biosynthesis protein)
MTKLFLTGDVMPGRGIDQILQCPGDPTLYERYIKSAQDYVRLAEDENGPIPRGVDLAYVWGDAAAVSANARPDFGIINLETAICNTGHPEPKGINYRMHPKNAAALPRLGIDCAILANNHVLDWGPLGLRQTLDTLRDLRIQTVGAGENAAAAAAPAVLSKAGNHRVLIFGFAAHNSGVPRHWSAGEERPGVNFLGGFNAGEVPRITRLTLAHKQGGDIVIVSLHWGGNWGYEVDAAHKAFAHELIEDAGVDVVYGHSSHHAKGLELYRGKLILYGCGDFINDYEGIRGYEQYRGELALMYLPEIDENNGGKLRALTVAPFRRAKFRLSRAPVEDVWWLKQMLNEQSTGADGKFSVCEDGLLRLKLR